MAYSRRTFLKCTSSAAAIGAMTQLRDRRLWAVPADLVPEITDDFLRELARAAMDAARQAGASFADIRINAARTIRAGGGYVGGGVFQNWPWIGFIGGFGVRAIVDGAWGFGSGNLLTLDAIVDAARVAAAGARTNRPRRARTLELAPRPVVADGVWEMPIEQDPFTVPLREQRDQLEAAFAPLTAFPRVERASFSLDWRKTTTVFAATDGSLVVQRLFVAQPAGHIVAGGDTDSWQAKVGVGVEGFGVGPYGYEALEAATLPGRVRSAAERASQLAKAAQGATSVEVGRYDLVFAPAATATLLTTTVAEAVRLSRALGYEANGAGTSFAAPPADILGRFQLGTPALTVHGDRTQPQGAATVGWDEEGVKPHPYTFIQNGVVVDYHADRQQVMDLAEWYRAQGRPVRAHGLARRTGDNLPVVPLPNLTMDPGPAGTTVDDLIRATTRGFYVESCNGVSDQQVLNTQCGAHHSAVREITNGRLGGYVRHFAFQFVTPEFWKQLDGLGDAATADARPVVTDSLAFYSNSEPFPFSTIRTVPMRIRDVNVLNVGRTT